MSINTPNQTPPRAPVDSCDFVSLVYAQTGMGEIHLTHDDFMTTTVNVPVAIDALAGPDDFDGTTSDLIFLNDPVGGTATIEGGSVVFTPDEGFVGTSTIHYMVEDSDGHSCEATISVEVQTQIAFDSFSLWAKPLERKGSDW